MDMPFADEIAERMKTMLPPEIRQKEEQQGGQQQIPPQVQAILQQAQQEIQQLQAELQEAKSGIAAKQIDAQVKAADIQSRERIEAAKLQLQATTAAQQDDLKRDLAELQGVIQLLVKQIQPPQQLAAEVSEDLSANGG